MKIGILTYQRANNYGAMLQCYALYSFLQSKNLEAEVIDYRNYHIENGYKIFRKRKPVSWFLKSTINSIIWYRNLKERIDNFTKFRREYIKLSKSYTKEEILNHGLDYDMIISGSDQIWNPKIANGFDEVYFQNFEGNFKRATYAVSVGNVDNPMYETSEFIQLVEKFDFLSVREKNTQEFLNEKLSKKVNLCLDPTLLINRSEWESLANKANIEIKSPYLLFYFVQPNPELVKTAEYLASKYNYAIAYFDPRCKFKCKSVCVCSAGPLEFLKLIRDAKIIVTNSFHGTIFSRIFNKDVVIIAYGKNDSRVNTLTNFFDIQSRIYYDFDDFIKNYKEESVIKYNKEIFEQQYETSLKYIDTIIGTV
ncbi:polysaccharide pyruvyl transferase family protein [Acetivibrio clariflavus]|uniref:polysaccharide pyruvyl transferase family protein n=1 Tax=Acetivibrio clariflavus TaxID=288965 RepID=UPI0031F5C0BE